MDVENLAKELILKNMTPEQQMAVLDSVRSSVAQAKEVQKRKIGENVDLVVQALKKIESDIRSRFDDVGNSIEKRVASIKDGRDGINGKDGRDGKDGRSGKDGAKGDKGDAGRDGRDGVDGVDGVSVTAARIDFDGSLVITLSSGVELNVGEVVAPDLAERIKVITNGGGTSQSVLDTLASLQTQINNLIPSQTGNSGKFLTTNGSALSWSNVAGALSYQGTWNASTNFPTLTSSVGTSGYYYVVATAGSTNLNGITSWNIGDWAIFNGTVWQKIDQSETLQFVTSADSSVTVTTTGATADLAVYSSPRLIAQVRNETGATLTKGTVVYINGAAGNKATVTKAIATDDSTSAQTFGLILADISTNNNGYAILAGDIAGLDTSAFTAGQQLYLSSTTAGAYTSTKQYAPNHLVYVGVVTRSHVNQGSIEVRIQNGYEMDELHNVSAQSPSNGQVLIYNESTSLWEKHTLTDGTGVSITEGAGSITVGLASGYGDTLNPYASKTSNYVLASPNGSAGVPTFRAIVAADIPTLNQNTTGTASNVTGTVAIANGGTGATSAATALTNLGAVAKAGDTMTGALGIIAGSASTPSLFASGDTNTGIFFPAADTIAFSEGGVEAMRINSSGNVGIGTNSPSDLLEVRKDQAATTRIRVTNKTSSGSATASILLENSTSDYASIGLWDSGTIGALTAYGLNIDGNGTGGVNISASNASGVLRFATGTSITERMRITSAGNVGIGTDSPSIGKVEAKDASKAQLSVYGWSPTGASDVAGAIYLGNTSAYQGRVWYDAFTGSVGTLVLENTQANSGAGITFKTQSIDRLRIDGSGNVGIGTSSPDIYSQGGRMFTVSNTTASGYAWATLAGGSGGGGELDFGNQTVRHAAIASLNGSSLAFYTNSTNSGTAVAQRMTIDSSGNVGIGTNAPGQKLEVYNAGGGPTIRVTSADTGTGSGNGFSIGLDNAGAAYLTQNENQPLILLTNATERARIDSSGNLMVGTTSVSGLITAQRNTAGSYSAAFGARAIGTANSQVAGIMFMPTFSNTSDYTPRRAADIWGGFNGNWGGEFLVFGVGTGAGNDAGNQTVERMRIDSSGNLTITGATATKASGTTWANPSDQRLKDNIRDYGKGTTELMQIRVREWEYNGKGGTIEGMKGLGVIADEVMTVLPATVENYDAKLNADDAETTAIKKFDATEITWLLVKTVQEQQAIIQTLTDRITALEKL